MSTPPLNPTTFRYPFDLKDESEESRQAHLFAFNGLLDLNQAVASLSSKVTTATISTSTSSTSSTASSSSTSAVTAQQATSIAATQASQAIASTLGGVNVQSAAYTTQSADYGGVVASTSTAVTLNTNVPAQYYTTVQNNGTANLIVTSASVGGTTGPLPVVSSDAIVYNNLQNPSVSNPGTWVGNNTNTGGSGTGAYSLDFNIASPSVSGNAMLQTAEGSENNVLYYRHFGASLGGATAGTTVTTGTLTIITSTPVISGTSFTVSVSATDTTYPVTAVQIYDGSTEVASTTTSSSLSYTGTNATGLHTITLKAFDSHGTVTSTVQTVPVNVPNAAAVQSMLLDEYFMFPTAGNTYPQALEFDPDLTSDNGWSMLGSIQFDFGGTGLIRLWNTAGNDWDGTVGTWSASVATPNVWHHLQLYINYDPTGHTYTYQTLVIDANVIFQNLGKQYSGQQRTTSGTDWPPDCWIEQQIDNASGATQSQCYYDSQTISIGTEIWTTAGSTPTINGQSSLTLAPGQSAVFFWNGQNWTAATSIAAAGGVTSLNTETGALSLTSTGGTVAITTPTTSTINLEATSTGGVSSLNSLTGALTLAAGSNITITPSGTTITIAASGSGGVGYIKGTGSITVNSSNPAGNTYTGTATVSGASTGQAVIITPTIATISTVCILTGYVSAANTVELFATFPTNYPSGGGTIGNINVYIVVFP